MARQRIFCTAALIAGCLWPRPASGGGPADFMITAQVGGRQLEGQPLLWDSREMALLGRDGVLYRFANKDAQQARKTRHGFSSYPASEMKTRLRLEFGKRFEVRSSSHFVVVHPPGPWKEWADRMESLYRKFVHSMQVRGIRLERPTVSMVAIVFRSKAAYYGYFAGRGQPLGAGTLGHYDPNSNRVYLYDDGRSQENLATVVHEATHQTAYNVGVHRRFAEQPRWLVEGLAMMFETPGMREAWSLQTRGRRVHGGRLRDFRHYLEKRPADTLLRLVTSDQLFRTRPAASYAEAWALNFYLFETRSHDYSRYLAKVASRPAFSGYAARDRLADFQEAFGADLQVIDNQLLRFVEELE